MDIKADFTRGDPILETLIAVKFLREFFGIFSDNPVNDFEMMEGAFNYSIMNEVISKKSKK